LKKWKKKTVRKSRKKDEKERVSRVFGFMVTVGPVLWCLSFCKCVGLMEGRARAPRAEHATRDQKKTRVDVLLPWTWWLVKSRFSFSWLSVFFWHDLEDVFPGFFFSGPKAGPKRGHANLAVADGTE
jgi:hypothetical protein